jgi:hypothetical protein
MNGKYRVNAIYPITGEIEKALLLENHFGQGRHAIRFEKDGLNAAHHAAWLIAWERIEEMAR